MLGSGKNRARRHNSLRVRLSVEPMEGRLMLSATALNLPQGLHSPQFVYSQAEINLISSPIQAINQPIDGGFISFDGATTTLRYNSAPIIANVGSNALFG